MKLNGLTTAVTDMKHMVTFYNAVFNAQLEPTVNIGDAQFYGGTIMDISLTFCPNAIAGVVAEQNRQQFRFQVDNIADVMAKGLANHGVEINQINEYKGAKVGSLADPDGNTIEFLELVE
jgi:predicted enzyme related to lactoylglutathione lyase